MAIYAFDGTTCKPSDLSNVFFMYDAYKSRHKFYVTGPGSRGTWLSKLYENITGSGGKDRIYDAFEIWKYWQSRGSRETIIIGFSRGAVMAREFANQISEVDGKIDFLGLYDSVGSFGLPINMTDIGYRKPIPSGVIYCAHALAINEERFTFRLIRAKPAITNTQTNIQECWFPGVHSDIGGTSKKGLGAATLNWMFEQAFKANTDKQWDPDTLNEVKDDVRCGEDPSVNTISLPARFLKSKRTRIISKDDCMGCEN